MKKAVLKNFLLVKLQAKRLQHKCFPEYCKKFKNIYFEEHLQTAASVYFV